MISNETLLLIFYLFINILIGVCLGLLHSRNFWREKYFKEVSSNEDIRTIR